MNTQENFDKPCPVLSTHNFDSYQTLCYDSQFSREATQLKVSHTQRDYSVLCVTNSPCLPQLTNSQTCLLLCCVPVLPGMGCLLNSTEEQEIQLVLSGTISTRFALGFLQLVTRTGGCIQPPKSSFEAELGKDFWGINKVFSV